MSGIHTWGSVYAGTFHDDRTSGEEIDPEIVWELRARATTQKRRLAMEIGGFVRFGNDLESDRLIVEMMLPIFVNVVKAEGVPMGVWHIPKRNGMTFDTEAVVARSLINITCRWRLTAIGKREFEGDLFLMGELSFSEVEMLEEGYWPSSLAQYGTTGPDFGPNRFREVDLLEENWRAEEGAFGECIRPGCQRHPRTNRRHQDSWRRDTASLADDRRY